MLFNWKSLIYFSVLAFVVPLLFNAVKEKIKRCNCRNC